MKQLLLYFLFAMTSLCDEVGAFKYIIIQKMRRR